jgi:UDP-apiose/xylose synthase
MFNVILTFVWWTPGWNPKTSLWDLLDSTLTYQHKTYAEAIKKVMSQPTTS